MKHNKYNLFFLIILLVLLLTSCRKNNFVEVIIVKYEIKINNGSAVVTYKNENGEDVTVSINSDWNVEFQAIRPFQVDISVIFTKTPNSINDLYGKMQIYKNGILVEEKESNAGNTIVEFRRSTTL